MSSSDDDSAVSETLTVPSRVGKTRKTTATATNQARARSHTPLRSLTPTKQDQRYKQYREEEQLISNEFKFIVTEGWSNPLTGVGLVHIKDKRSDDGNRTHQGINLTILCHSKAKMENITLRLAVDRADKTRNRIILGLPKLDESIKMQKKELIKSCKESHGKCESRDEGFRRSFSKILSNDIQWFELTVIGVGDLTNSEWQGEKFKQDPCFLNVSRDVIGKSASTAFFRVSAEIACVEGVEDVSDDETDGDDREKRRLERKLNHIGYDESDESSLWSESEEEESEGELGTTFKINT